MNNINAQITYLIGLITGRGHFFVENKTIAIEFSHTNEFVYGIAHCHKCGFLATKNGEKLICKNKNCGNEVDPSQRTSYNQPKATKDSLDNVIIPFLKTYFDKVIFDILGNNSMTILVLDFNKCNSEFNYIKSFFPEVYSYDSFHIPKEIHDLDKKLKIEYVNGLLDTSGFPSPGGWLNRDGEHGHGRMRVYFQVVRNWHLPVEIDNLLRGDFNLPVHTIDWGHPNIRDANLEDYFNTRTTSWSREHQVKFFPEYYTAFKFRISYKQSLFNELYTHNLNVSFTNKEDWFPPKPISLNKLKPYHPGEADPRIPTPARRHFDAFWQINYVMGCKFLKNLSQSSSNPDAFLLTGDSNVNDLPRIKKMFDLERTELTKSIESSHNNNTRVLKKVINSRVAYEAKEKTLYEPIGKFLGGYLHKKYFTKVVIVDNSAYNLNLLIKNSANTELLSKFEFCDKFRIKPDVVGFLTEIEQLVFIEAKITPLDLKCLGQLLGYCLVAQPIEAILVSNKKPSLSLIKILKSNHSLLQYDKDKFIEIGFWNGSEIEIIKI